MNTLKSLLYDLTKIKGLNAAVVASRDGFVIEGSMHSETVDMDTMAALITAGASSSEVMARGLGAGELKLNMIECDQGTVVMVNLSEDAILAVTADLNAQIGNIRYQLKKQLDDIIAVV